MGACLWLMALARIARAGAGCSVLLGLAALAGCTSVEQIVDPLNVLGLAKPPVRIGVTTLGFSPPPLMIPKRGLFQQDLSYHLKEPVALDLMTPRQIRVHLGTGRLKFAMLTPMDYAEIAPADTCKILAVPKNARGDIYRRGLIIVAPHSPIHTLSELKGRRFHFLPKDEYDPLNQAALGPLIEAGLEKKEVDRGILGLELDTTHISSLEVAKSVVLEEKVGGVIDEADYNKWPDKGGSFVLLLPSKDQVRIIAKTVRVPEGPFVVSNQAPPELVDKTRDYLLKVVNKKQVVLAALGSAGFAEPIDPQEYEPFFALYRKLHPAPPEPATTESPAESTAPVNKGGAAVTGRPGSTPAH